MSMINVKYPDSLANMMKLSSSDFEKEMKTSSMVKLYELGRISSATAAEILNMSRASFLDLLSRYKVSVFDVDESELNQDFNNAR